MLPSIDETTSPTARPAFWAGDPSIGLVITSRQAGPSGVHPAVPSGARDAISAPIPSNCPLMPWRLWRYSSEVMYDENGSPSDPIIPRMAPWISAVRSTAPPA